VRPPPAARLPPPPLPATRARSLPAPPISHPPNPPAHSDSFSPFTPLTTRKLDDDLERKKAYLRVLARTEYVPPDAPFIASVAESLYGKLCSILEDPELRVKSSLDYDTAIYGATHQEKIVEAKGERVLDALLRPAEIETASSAVDCTVGDRYSKCGEDVHVLQLKTARIDEGRLAFKIEHNVEGKRGAPYSPDHFSRLVVFVNEHLDAAQPAGPLANVVFVATAAELYATGRLAGGGGEGTTAAGEFVLDVDSPMRFLMAGALPTKREAGVVGGVTEEAFYDALHAALRFVLCAHDRLVVDLPADLAAALLPYRLHVFRGLVERNPALGGNIGREALDALLCKLFDPVNARAALGLVDDAALAAARTFGGLAGPVAVACAFVRDGTVRDFEAYAAKLTAYLLDAGTGGYAATVAAGKAACLAKPDADRRLNKANRPREATDKARVRLNAAFANMRLAPYVELFAAAHAKADDHSTRVAALLERLRHFERLAREAEAAAALGEGADAARPPASSPPGSRCSCARSTTCLTCSTRRPAASRVARTGGSSRRASSSARSRSPARGAGPAARARPGGRRSTTTRACPWRCPGRRATAASPMRTASSGATSATPSAARRASSEWRRSPTRARPPRRQGRPSGGVQPQSEEALPRRAGGRGALRAARRGHRVLLRRRRRRRRRRRGRRRGRGRRRWRLGRVHLRGRVARRALRRGAASARSPPPPRRCAPFPPHSPFPPTTPPVSVHHDPALRFPGRAPPPRPPPPR
jgi:hypothetical protein